MWRRTPATVSQRYPTTLQPATATLHRSKSENSLSKDLRFKRIGQIRKAMVRGLRKVGHLPASELTR